MKEKQLTIKTFVEGDLIPEGSKFLHMAEEWTSDTWPAKSLYLKRIFYYQVGD